MECGIEVKKGGMRVDGDLEILTVIDIRYITFAVALTGC